MEDSTRHGWVKLHRKLLDHPRFTDGDWLKVWTACLALATHKPLKVIFEGEPRTLQPGQFITSRKSLAEKTGVQESKVERLLTSLKTEQQIEQLSTRKNRLISVKNWEKYQTVEQQNEHQVNTNRTPSEHKQELKELKELREDLPSEKKGGLEGVKAEGAAPLNGTPKKDPAAPAGKPRTSDPIWDTVCKLFSLKPVDTREKKRVGAVCSTLRQKEATPEKIRAVFSKMEKENWDPFSPEGLVKWYDQLSAKPAAPVSPSAYVPRF